ncbi:hypothetical protein LINPERPRIM_LOCUS31559 [Linum perenne]
MFIINLFF